MAQTNVMTQERTAVSLVNAFGFMILGSLLQALYYGTVVVYGFMTNGGTMSENVMVDSLAGVSFLGSVVVYNIALLILNWQLRPQAKVFFTISLVIAAISFTLVPAGLIAAPLFGVHIGVFGGLGQMTKLLAVTFFAIGVLRSQALPRYLGLIMLILGTVTFPLIVAAGTPLPLPLYVTSELPFFIEGLVWMFVAFRLPRER